MRVPRFGCVPFLCLVAATCGRAGTADDSVRPGKGKRGLDNNLHCVDLSGLKDPLPLDVAASRQILKRSEDWECPTWRSPNWPKSKGRDSLGYPTVVRNDRGKKPDGKYYLYYAHHDPCSGIGCAVADAIDGPYKKLAELDPKRKHSMVLANPHYPAPPGDPSHYSSPCVIWNEEEQLWLLYFHFYNHLWGKWRGGGKGRQMTALATCQDLASHNWTVVKDASAGAVHDLAPVLPTTKKPWMGSQSSYHAMQRLPDGRWLAFLRGTPESGPPKLGFATSRDGRKWRYFPENPVIHQDDGGGGRKGVYRPSFIGYLGKNGSGKHKYLVVWAESPAAGDVPKPVYGTTTDFVKVKRDPRGYAKWPAGDGLLSPWRVGNRLYLFAGKRLHVMTLPVSPEGARKVHGRRGR